LDSLAKDLNINRQAIIKTFLRQSLDQHYLDRLAIMGVLGCLTRVILTRNISFDKFNASVSFVSKNNTLGCGDKPHIQMQEGRRL
jgi:hypothetical protein